MSAARCYYFALGMPEPKRHPVSKPTCTLAELAAEIFTVPRSSVRAYKISADIDPYWLPWKTWEQTIAHLAALDLDTKAGAVDGHILLTDFVEAPRSSSPTPSIPCRSYWAWLDPAEAAKLEHYIKRQRADDDTTIYNGRPVQCTGPSVCCYVSAFYDFKAAVRRSDVDIPHDDERIVPALKLMETACCLFDAETERQKTVYQKKLAQYLGCLCPAVTWKMVEHSDFDGSLAFSPEASASAQPFELELCELALLLGEINDAGSDPEHRAACDYDMYCRWKTNDKWRARCCMPALLFHIRRYDIVINAAIYLGGPVVGRLYRTSLDVQDEDDVAAAKRLVHVFASLSKALTALGDFYRTLTPANIKHFIPPSYPIAGWEVQWLGSLPPRQTRSGRMVFKANVQSSTYTGLAVIKFAVTYSEDAHRQMQALGAAVPLLYYAFDEVIGRHVVITAYHEKAVEPLDRPDVQRLRDALVTFHGAGFVFGGLRMSNIVRGEGVLKLIDFDWAGRRNKARYPDIDQELDWADGVLSYALVQPEHDIAMLEKLPTKAA